MEFTPAIQRLHRAWSMYDWANSGYNLVMTATIFPIYFMNVSRDGNDATPDYVSFFGWEVLNSSLYNYALALAFLIVAVLSPILSSVADYQGTKKDFMKAFCYAGAAACCALFFFQADGIEFGVIMLMVAAIAYGGSIVFNNAYLPEIAPQGYRDTLSAKGYAYGYIGSVLLQLICLALVMNMMDKGLASRLSFLLVGLWWIGFAQIPIFILPKGQPLGKNFQHSIWYNGIHELRKVWSEIRHMPLLKRFLAAFFFYSIGVQTVMFAAAIFAEKEIRQYVNGEWVALGDKELIMIVLIIQLVAIVGALLMAVLSKRVGNLWVLILTVVIWMCICAAAYYTRTATAFYMLAAAVGLVMGGIQSMSRSTFSKMMPETRDTASYFSFFNVAEKLSAAIGLFTFGFMEQLTGSMRTSIFALGAFFFCGLILLILAKQREEERPFLKPIG